MEIQADDVTFDLNGFAVRNESASGNSDGISSSARVRIEIRNGLIIGWRGDGIAARNTNSQDHRLVGLRVSGNAGDGLDLAGGGHLVRDCSITENGQIGILMFADGSGMVINSIIRGNTGLGLSAFGDAFAGNTIADNNEGNANQQVGSAIAIGCNMIGTAAVCP